MSSRSAGLGVALVGEPLLELLLVPPKYCLLHLVDLLRDLRVGHRRCRACRPRSRTPRAGRGTRPPASAATGTRTCPAFGNARFCAVYDFFARASRSSSAACVIDDAVDDGDRVGGDLVGAAATGGDQGDGGQRRQRRARASASSSPLCRRPCGYGRVTACSGKVRDVGLGADVLHARSGGPASGNDSIGQRQRPLERRRPGSRPPGGRTCRRRCRRSRGAPGAPSRRARPGRRSPGRRGRRGSRRRRARAASFASWIRNRFSTGSGSGP